MKNCLLELEFFCLSFNLKCECLAFKSNGTSLCADEHLLLLVKPLELNFAHHIFFLSLKSNRKKVKYNYTWPSYIPMQKPMFEKYFRFILKKKEKKEIEQSNGRRFLMWS